MDLSYNFSQNREPTDQQLELLMHEVALDARKKREKADRDYQEIIRKEIDLARKRADVLISKNTNGKA